RRLREGVVSLERELVAMDPHRVLRRGYSLTTHADGRILRSARQAKAGETILTRVADGSLTSVVKTQEPQAMLPTGSKSDESLGRAIAGPRPRRSIAAPAQMDLFSTSR